MMKARQRFSSVGVMLIWVLAAVRVTGAEADLLDVQLRPGPVLELRLQPVASAYYSLQWSYDMASFTNLGLALGDNPTWAVSLTGATNQGFFRTERHSIFEPVDTDHDGIDDLYELRHSACLDPLNYYDASQPCLTNGMSNYQFYLRNLFGSPTDAPRFISREQTVFNFGAPTARLEAISPEYSVYNSMAGSSPPGTALGGVISREVSIWNFGSPTAEREAISREISLWNFGSPSADREAISQEVSIYNAYQGSAPPSEGFANSISREVSLFNLGEPTARWEAITREVSVLNFQDPVKP